VADLAAEVCEEIVLLRPGYFYIQDGERRERLGRLPECIEGSWWGTAARARADRFGGQASKGIRWMPWHQEAMKDVAKLRKATGSRKQASIRGSPNRETGMDEVHAAPGRIHRPEVANEGN
jgi:hypothetical protein